MKTLRDLERSVLLGDYASCDSAIRAEPERINARDELDESALHLACWARRPLIASILLHDGAEVNRAGMAGLTPLHYAARAGGSNIFGQVPELCRYGAKRSARDAYGLCPWNWAMISARSDLPALTDLLASIADGESAEPVRISHNDVVHALAHALKAATDDVASGSSAKHVSERLEQHLFREFVADQLLVELSHMLLTRVAADRSSLLRVVRELAASNDDGATLGEWCQEAASCFRVDAGAAAAKADGEGK